MTTPVDFIKFIDVSLLKVVCPERTLVQLGPWVDPIKKAFFAYNITSIRRIGSALANAAHESGLIPGREENLNYSDQGLADTWPNRYAINPKATKKVPNAKARALNRKPEQIANDVYSNRMGNSDAASGDGWRFKGNGLIQITGRKNWFLFGKTIGMTAEKAVEYGRTLEGDMMSFAWFWSTNNLNSLADTPGVEDETFKINGGYNGLDDRRDRFNNIVKEIIRRERLMRA